MRLLLGLRLGTVDEAGLLLLLLLLLGTSVANRLFDTGHKDCCCIHFLPVLMKPALRPSKPARSSFFSLLAFLFSSLAADRASRLPLRL
jgi:hypothetical protein